MSECRARRHGVLSRLRTRGLPSAAPARQPASGARTTRDQTETLQLCRGAVPRSEIRQLIQQKTEDCAQRDCSVRGIHGESKTIPGNSEKIPKQRLGHAVENSIPANR